MATRVGDGGSARRPHASWSGSEARVREIRDLAPPRARVRASEIARSSSRRGSPIQDARHVAARAALETLPGPLAARTSTRCRSSGV